jgi:hypothetical protein
MDRSDSITYFSDTKCSNEGGIMSKTTGAGETTTLSSVLQELLSNATNPDVVAELTTPDATYVSVSFDNPDLKKILPWAGTHKGPREIVDAYTGVLTFWKALEIKITDTIEQENRVAFFGTFTYESNTTGKRVTSPFGLYARFQDGKINYLEFLEDTYGTAGSFKIGGATRFHSDPAGGEVEV